MLRLVLYSRSINEAARRIIQSALSGTSWRLLTIARDWVCWPPQIAVPGPVP